MQWTGVCTIIKKVGDNSYEVSRDDKRNTPSETYNVDRLVRVPNDTKLLEPDLDIEDDMHGLLQMPEDYEARKEAYERKRTQREKEQIIAERRENDAKSEVTRRTTRSMSRQAHSKPKEHKWIAVNNQPSSMELLAKDLKLRTWKELRVGDKALKLSGKRWLPVQVLKLIPRGNKAKIQYMWPKRDAPAKDNATADWAPLWENPRRKNGDQRSQWSKPPDHEPHTTICKRSTLKYVGIQLQSYTLKPTGRRRFRVHPVWWAMIEKDSAVFRAFAV